MTSNVVLHSRFNRCLMYTELHSAGKRRYILFSSFRSLYSFYATTVGRKVPQSTTGDSHQSMQFTRISYAHVLSLEFAALASLRDARCACYKAVARDSTKTQNTWLLSGIVCLSICHDRIYFVEFVPEVDVFIIIVVCNFNKLDEAK